MHIFMCIHTNIFQYLFVRYIHIYIYIHVCTYTCLYTYVYIYMFFGVYRWYKYVRYVFLGTSFKASEKIGVKPPW